MIYNALSLVFILLEYLYEKFYSNLVCPVCFSVEKKKKIYKLYKKNFCLNNNNKKKNKVLFIRKKKCDSVKVSAQIIQKFRKEGKKDLTSIFLLISFNK